MQTVYVCNLYQTILNNHSNPFLLKGVSMIDITKMEIGSILHTCRHNKY